ncbi:uncharacterized protein [Antedon mediterranea]|uniref:uncharacterized protein n=1 Tax=Antedon mediterranea TaxID=105859 RepID=UPI003AF5127E
MSENISSLLECPLCFEPFDNNIRLPKMLSCQHTSCLDCLDRIVGKKKKVQCPTCRYEYKVPKTGVKALPNNLTIISMMCHVTEKQRRLLETKQSNIEALRQTILSKIQNVNDKMPTLESIKQVTKTKKNTDQKSLIKSIDDCFQTIYLSLEKRREVLRNDVDDHFKKENDITLRISTIEENKRKAATFCSTVVDTLEGNSNLSEEELTSLSHTATDVLPKIRELTKQILDVNTTIENNRPIVFSNVMEASLVSQISCLGKIQQTNNSDSDIQSSKNINDLIGSTRNIAIDVKEQNKHHANPEAHGDHNETCNNNENPSGKHYDVESKRNALKVVLNGHPVCYNWNDEEPVTFGLTYFDKLEEGPLDLALIRNANNIKELAVTTEFSQSVGVFDEKLSLDKKLCDEPWFGHVRGLCTDDRGRLVTVTNIGDIYLFDNTCISSRNKRIYSVYQGQGAVHSDFASTKCGIAMTSKRVIYLANDRDGCIDAIRGRTGKLIRKIGKNQCMEARGISLTSDEKILVADARNHCVWLFTPDGQCVRKYGKQGNDIGELSEPWGVDVDRDDNVVVADTGNHRIQIFDKDGKCLAILGEHGSNAGQFDWPMSVTVTINRKIIVCDSGNYRIQIL